MKHPRSIIGTLAATEAFRRPGRRRAIFAVLIAICAVLAIFPERYRAAVTLAPTDPSALGLGGALGQLGAAQSVFGNQTATEVTQTVARSVLVRGFVIDKVDLMRRKGFHDRVDAFRWLDRQVTIRTIRGGMVQMETQLHDPDLARALITAYASITRQQLAIINRQQTSYKRRVLEKLVAEANDRLDRAQAAYDVFRLRTRYSDPRAAIEAIGDRIPALQAAIKAKEVQLSAEEQFATGDNMSVRQIRAELRALQSQLAQQQALNPEQENSVGRVVQESTKGKRLERELLIAQSLYEGYNRYLQGTAVEDMTSSANMRIIEQPFIDTARQFNMVFLLLGFMLALLAFAIEFYNLRPPLEAHADD